MADNPVQTRLLPPDAEGIRVAAAALRDGALVAFPTDTVFGLGAHTFLPDAVARIYQVKGRGERKPIALLLSGVEDIALVAATVPPAARRLAERFWPGALTIVLPAHPAVPAVVRGGGLTVGLRVPDHPLARDLIRGVGVPLATSSANRSGEASLTTAAQVLAQLGGLIEYIVEGECPGGVASTVVDLSVDPAAIVREGAISRREIEVTLQGL